jgi:hypothetical protein
MMKTIAAVVCGMLVCATGTASAQGFPLENKIFVNVSGGGTTGANDVRQHFSFEYLLEQATVETTRRVGGGGLFDFTAGATVIDNWVAGISFTKSGGNSNASYTASIPDPIETDLFRPVSGTINDMKHSESWFAFLAGYMLPKFPALPDFMDKVDLMVLAGPVRAGVKHEVVSAVSVSETDSGPSVSLDRQTISKGFWGIQVGVDARYMFTEHIGAGLFLRYSGASGDVVDGLNLDLGGFQFAVGGRFKF